MAELDLRIIKISIEVGGEVRTYTSSGAVGFNIKATGSKYANENQNEAEISISNLNNETQNYILTQTSPFNSNTAPKRVVLEAGRQSYGTSVVFVGNIINSVISQPPDTTITLKCLTGNYLKGNILARAEEDGTPLSVISKNVANDLEKTLVFEAKEKKISNYTFTGGALNQVSVLANSGEIDAYIDDDLLIVKDQHIPLANRITIVNIENGMVGIPEFTEQGIKITYLFDSQTVLGGTLRVSSKLNPAVDGDYVIYKLNFDLATREDPFYWTAEALRR